jgi:hypothetical protein
LRPRSALFLLKIEKVTVKDQQKVRQYIKNQKDRDAMEDRYDTDLVKDPFRGASSILKKEEDKE